MDMIGGVLFGVVATILATTYQNSTKTDISKVSGTNTKVDTVYNVSEIVMHDTTLIVPGVKTKSIKNITKVGSSIYSSVSNVDIVTSATKIDSNEYVSVFDTSLNGFSIFGNIRSKLITDSITNILHIDTISFKDSIDIVLNTVNTKDGTMVIATTSSPVLTVQTIKSITVPDKQYSRRRWGVGITTGYGIVLSDGKVRYGPCLSAGITYSF